MSYWLKIKNQAIFREEYLDIALVGCKQPLGVICGPERHLFETNGYLKILPVHEAKVPQQKNQRTKGHGAKGERKKEARALRKPPIATRLGPGPQFQSSGR